MGQRLISFLIVIVMFVLAGVYAITNGVFPPLGDLSSNLLVFVTPVIGVFITLNSWFNVLDSKVADGSLDAGDVSALFTLSEFYVSMVACLAGVFQSVGLKVIDEATQAFIVNSALVLVNVLLRSFTERTPKATITKTQIVTTQKAQAVENAKR